jgi:hypothetical protein
MPNTAEIDELPLPTGPSGVVILPASVTLQPVPLLRQDHPVSDQVTQACSKTQFLSKTNCASAPPFSKG